METDFPTQTQKTIENMTCKRLHSLVLQNWTPKSHITQGILSLMFRAFLLICLSSWFSFQWYGWPQSGIPSLFLNGKWQFVWTVTHKLLGRSKALSAKEFPWTEEKSSEKFFRICVQKVCFYPWCVFFFFFLQPSALVFVFAFEKRKSCSSNMFICLHQNTMKQLIFYIDQT